MNLDEAVAANEPQVLAQLMFEPPSRARAVMLAAVHGHKELLHTLLQDNIFCTRTLYMVLVELVRRQPAVATLPLRLFVGALEATQGPLRTSIIMMRAMETSAMWYDGDASKDGVLAVLITTLHGRGTRLRMLFDAMFRRNPTIVRLVMHCIDTKDLMFQLQLERVMWRIILAETEEVEVKVVRVVLQHLQSNGNTRTLKSVVCGTYSLWRTLVSASRWSMIALLLKFFPPGDDPWNTLPGMGLTLLHLARAGRKTLFLAALFKFGACHRVLRARLKQMRSALEGGHLHIARLFVDAPHPPGHAAFDAHLAALQIPVTPNHTKSWVVAAASGGCTRTLPFVMQLALRAGVMRQRVFLLALRQCVSLNSSSVAMLRYLLDEVYPTICDTDIAAIQFRHGLRNIFHYAAYGDNLDMVRMMHEVIPGLSLGDITPLSPGDIIPLIVPRCTRRMAAGKCPRVTRWWRSMMHPAPPVLVLRQVVQAQHRASAAFEAHVLARMRHTA